GQRGRRVGKLRIALDQGDGAGKALLAHIVGDRGPDDGPADDNDVVTHFLLRSVGPQATGRLISKRVPRSVSTSVIVPSCAFRRASTMPRPMPVPPASSLVVMNGSNTLSWLL